MVHLVRARLDDLDNGITVQRVKICGSTYISFVYLKAVFLLSDISLVSQWAAYMCLMHESPDSPLFTSSV